MSFRDVLVILEERILKAYQLPRQSLPSRRRQRLRRAFQAIACAIKPRVPRSILGDGLISVSAMVGAEHKKSEAKTPRSCWRPSRNRRNARTYLGQRILPSPCFAFEVPEGAGQRPRASSRRHHSAVAAGRRRSGTSTHGGTQQTVIFQSGHPAIVLPAQSRGPVAFETVIVAWDKSRTATRAVADAIPILRKAKHVTLLTVTGESRSRHGSRPRILPNISSCTTSASWSTRCMPRAIRSAASFKTRRRSVARILSSWALTDIRACGSSSWAARPRACSAIRRPHSFFPTDLALLSGTARPDKPSRSRSITVVNGTPPAPWVGPSICQAGCGSRHTHLGTSRPARSRSNARANPRGCQRTAFPVWTKRPARGAAALGLAQAARPIHKPTDYRPDHRGFTRGLRRQHQGRDRHLRSRRPQCVARLLSGASRRAESGGAPEHAADAGKGSPWRRCQ